MSWADKALKKAKREDDLSNAFDYFMLLTIDYMYRVLNMDHENIMNFINFAVDQFGFARFDSTYFQTLNSELLSDIGVGIVDGKMVEINND